jgi:TonB family protein
MANVAKRIALTLAVVLLCAPAFAGQATSAPAKPSTAPKAAPNAAPDADAQPATVPDPELTAAQNLIGQALFLRAFPGSKNLAYDASGSLQGKADASDWTLAAVNILKASHPAPNRIELEGVRVAIRYNPDAHEFQRHPLNDERMKLSIQVTPSPVPVSDRPPGEAYAPDAPSVVKPRALLAAFAAIFSVGIDPALQRSMPPLWRHYFDPSVPWPADPIGSATIYPIPPLAPLPGPAIEIVPPILAHQGSSQMTPSARHDRVQGTVQLRLVVDSEGNAQRIVVTRPLGYGLDRQAAESVAKWRFDPALHAGQPVAAAILVNIDFVPPPPGR